MARASIIISLASMCISLVALSISAPPVIRHYLGERAERTFHPLQPPAHGFGLSVGQRGTGPSGVGRNATPEEVECLEKLDVASSMSGGGGGASHCPPVEIEITEAEWK